MLLQCTQLNAGLLLVPFDLNISHRYLLYVEGSSTFRAGFSYLYKGLWGLGRIAC